MKHTSSPKTNIQQRSKKHRPLFRCSQKTSWRIKKYEVNIAKRTKIIVKVRSFTTPPHKRSKKIKQHVFRVHIMGAKEVAVEHKKIHPRRKATSNTPLFKFNLANVLTLAGCVGLFVFGLLVAGIGRTNPPTVNAQAVQDQKMAPVLLEPIKQQYLPASVPSKIDIPRIGVSAAIQKVGLLDDGTIETPAILSNLVGWYQYGPTPGELGPSVLVGHVDSYKGPSVFWNLSKLHIEDTVNITRSDGITVQFIVSRIAQYGQDNFLTHEVYGDIDHAGLRIITCGGTYNHLTGRYSQNTVIYADLAM